MYTFAGKSARGLKALRGAEKILRAADKKSRIGSHFEWTSSSRGGSVDFNAVNRNLQPPVVALATPAKPPVQNRTENDDVASHLDREAAQIVIQVVDDETKPVQSEGLPEDVLQLGEVVKQPEGRAIR
jgi:hypothetical protein